ncbi:MAG: hypothetical protein QG629_858 [Patescibacteria group bacterium]|nr:histidine phosphatase family protein [Candidatus Saccharibacteria bacterium]MDQ5963775.1 hypothetical protein [Patescibacteria group bacterium]
MSEFPAKHLVLVRHGESEGDVRRGLTAQPTSHALLKHPLHEEQTSRGHEQSVLSGQWIAKFVLQPYAIEGFDWQYTSPLIRTKQSAESLGLLGKWSEDPRLSERDRGKIQGMTKLQHQDEYPQSYTAMLEAPLAWAPPEGESLLKVLKRFSSHVHDFVESEATMGICMTHRDVMWMAHAPLDGMSRGSLANFDSSALDNAHIMHYTNVEPSSGRATTRQLVWKRSCTPWLGGSGQPVRTIDWTQLSLNNL